MTAMGEPEFVDQVPRREAYEDAHPEVKITFHRPYWKAMVTEEAGQTVITRYELRDVLGTNSKRSTVSGDWSAVRIKEQDGHLSGLFRSVHPGA